MKKLSHYIKPAKLTGCLAAIILLAITAGCKKVIDVGAPQTSLAATTVFNSDATAEASISGIFTYMANYARMYNGQNSVAIQEGLRADELQNFSSSTVGNTLFYTNNLSSQDNYYWPEIFAELYICNSAINGLTASTALTPAIKQQLLGEAKFARAFIFFNAVNLYGDVPLALSTDQNVNSHLSRSPAADVLKQVILDLTDAQGTLPDNAYVTLAGVVSTSTYRILPNKQAASALLARVYLYMQNWKDAETQASNVISASSYLLEPTLTNVFLRTSRETIWQLQSVSTNYFGNADEYQLIMTAAPNGSLNVYPLSNSLIGTFESGDKRLTNWVGTFQSGTTTYYYAYKYKQNLVSTAAAVNEYPIMFRLAEQYLIRAEARAQQSNLTGAQSDLNAIRSRAGLINNAATAQTQLLTDIYRERQIELFTEFGHRWFDLKRTGRLDGVMNTAAPLKGGTWSPYKALLPIPASEISINTNLVQTAGYN